MQLNAHRYGHVAAFLHLFIRRYAGLALLAATLLLAVSMPAPVSAQTKAWRVLAFGDSLTAGYQLKPAESFPARLQAVLKARGLNVVVQNAGVSGDTTTQALARLPWVLNSLSDKPDLVIVALGANDMLRGQSPARAQANLDAMVQELRRRDIPVLLAGMRAAPNMGADYARQFEPIYAAVAKKHGLALYPFLTKGVTGNAELLLADGMHPNAQGAIIMARRITPMVERQLRPTAGGK